MTLFSLSLALDAVKITFSYSFHSQSRYNEEFQGWSCRKLQTNESQAFYYSQIFLVGSSNEPTPPLWRDLVKILTIKLWHTSSFSLEHTDFENVVFEKIHWAPSEDAEVAEVKRLWKLPDFNTFLEGAQWIFSKITLSKSVRSNEKDEVCHNFIVKIFTKSLHRGGVTPCFCQW